MYQLRTPAPELLPFIEHYWFVTPDEAPMRLRVDVFVDGRADLVFNHGDPWTREVIGGDTTSHDGPCLDAQRTVPIRVHQRGSVRICGVRFRLGGVAPFARAPLHPFTNHTPLPEAVFDPSVSDLAAALAQADTVDAQAAQLDAFFRGTLQPGAGHASFARALDRLVEAEGGAPLPELARAAAVSARQLDRLFRQHLGIPPKTVARVLRFQRALRALMRDVRGSLSDLAADAGYFDHAHFIKDFRKMTGGVPRGYRGYFPPEAPHDFAPNVVVYDLPRRP